MVRTGGQQGKAGRVVADDVPAVYGMFVAQVWDELGDRQLATGPRDDRLRLARQHVVDGRAHPLLVVVQSQEEFAVRQRLERCLAFLERARLRHRIALEIRVEMPDDLHGNTGHVCCDLGHRPAALTDPGGASWIVASKASCVRSSGHHSRGDG